MIHCPFCGKLTDPKLENCVHCGGLLSKAARPPAEEETPEEQAARAEESEAQAGAEERGAEPSAQPEHGPNIEADLVKPSGPPKPSASVKPSASANTCPNCGAHVQSGDIICVSCGTNLLTGQRIAPGEERRAEAPPPRTSDKWKWGRVAAAIGGVLLLLLILAGLFFALRNPVDRALRMAERGRPTEAQNILIDHLQNDPDDGRAHFALAQLYQSGNEYEEAADAFESAARLMPGDERAALLSAINYARTGGEENRRKAEAVLERLTEEAPDSSRAWLLLAEMRAALDKPAEQAAALERALELNPDDAEARLSLGVAFALAERYTEARQALARAEEQGAPADLLAAAEGLVYALSGEAEPALERLETAAQSAELLQNEALTQMGLLMLQQSRFNAAESVLQQSVDSGQAQDAGRFFHALALRAEGLTQEALPELELIMEGAGDYAAPAAVQTARIFLDLDQPANAQDALTRAQELGADSAMYYTIQGRLYARQDNVNDARDAFDRALRADPTYAPARLEMGLLYVRRGQTPQGIQELQEYLRLVNPELPDTRIAEVEALIEQLQKTVPTAGRGA
jgi:tetratricopeptide (TPR) repeat protein